MRSERCCCGATLRMPSTMDLWTAPMRLHVESEQHQLWRAKTSGTPHLYGEPLRERPAAEPPYLIARSSACTNGTPSVRRVA